MDADFIFESKGTVLLVDDNARYRAMLIRFIRSMGLTCIEAEDGVEALACLEENAGIDIVLCDLHMPRMNGLTLLGHVVERWPDTSVLMISGAGDLDLAVNCLSKGAVDFIAKPFQLAEMRARIQQVIDRRRLVREAARLRVENQSYQRRLEERVVVQDERIETLFLDSITSIADALEAKDPYTHGHSVRVSSYAALFARELGCADDLVRDIILGGNIHDVGKIGIPEALLHKPARLTTEEYAEVMRHPQIGVRILGPLLRDAPVALNIVRSHHERHDGKGLPDGLEGADIPLEARIVAVADSFDAMTSNRPYRLAGLSWDAAVDEIRRGRETQFAPEVVDAFLACIAKGSLTPQARAALDAAPPHPEIAALIGTYHPYAMPDVTSLQPADGASVATPYA